MESDRKPRRRVPLRTKLLLAIVAVAALMLGFLLLYFGPATEQSFSAASDEWIERTSAAMRELSRTDNENGQRLLNDLIRHSADARRRALLDIPWSLYSGDATLVSRAIEAQDAARSRRLARNVEVLGKELNRRAELRIAAYVETWNGQQRTVATAFGSRLRTLYLGLSGGVLLVLLLVLALGLDRAIVRPVRVLRQATQKVASRS